MSKVEAKEWLNELKAAKAALIKAGRTVDEQLTWDIEDLTNYIRFN